MSPLPRRRDAWPTRHRAFGLAGVKLSAMASFDLLAVFLLLVGVSGWINARFFHLPTAAVMVLAGLIGGGLLFSVRTVLPDAKAPAGLIDAIQGLNFPQAVLGYMLAFLLFAGAMQVDFVALKQRFWAVLSLATLGVLASTVIVGGGLWMIAQGLSLRLPLPWAIVFGALISPTDPIAVLAAVKQGSLSKTIEVVLQGEALFNDGVGIVVFSAALALTAAGGSLHPVASMLHVGGEAIGGMALGWLGSWITIRAIRSIDDYAVEVGLTLSLAVGIYALAQSLHVSGPIAVVVAGLLVGDVGVRTAMGDLTQRYVRGFWALIDEILNALLFLMLGLEALVVHFDVRLAGLWVAAIALVLLARLVVVLPWGAYFHFRQNESRPTTLLAWGGLHGALSLALALTLPSVDEKALILSVTFAVVIFSMLVQGLSFGRLANRLASPAVETDRA